MYFGGFLFPFEAISKASLFLRVATTTQPTQFEARSVALVVGLLWVSLKQCKQKGDPAKIRQTPKTKQKGVLLANDGGAMCRWMTSSMS